MAQYAVIDVIINPGEVGVPKEIRKVPALIV